MKRPRVKARPVTRVQLWPPGYRGGAQFKLSCRRASIKWIVVNDHPAGAEISASVLTQPRGSGWSNVWLASAADVVLPTSAEFCARGQGRQCQDQPPNAYRALPELQRNATTNNAKIAPIIGGAETIDQTIKYRVSGTPQAKCSTI
jgi:hypothetical protein